MDLQLKRLRKQAGLTQAELAQKIGTTLRVVSAWERGETDLPLDFAIEIANVFHCSLDALAGRDQRPSFSDPGQEQLNYSYESLNEHGKDTLKQVARSMELDPANRRSDEHRELEGDK